MPESEGSILGGLDELAKRLAGITGPDELVSLTAHIWKPGGCDLVTVLPNGARMISKSIEHAPHSPCEELRRAKGNAR